MPTQWETFPIKFGGGLITSMGRLEQGIQNPGSATVLENFEEDVLGGYTRVQGYRKFDEQPVPGVGQIKSSIAVSRIGGLALRDEGWYHSIGEGWTSKLAVPNVELLNKTHHDYFNFDGNLRFVITDGLHQPAVYDSVTNTMSFITGNPDTEGASWVRVFKNHIFYAKDQNLIFTAPYEWDNFGTGVGAGIINVGDDITGLIVFREQLIVFCLNKIFRVTGFTEADFNLSEITTNSGALCGHTVQEVGGDVMYLGPDGIRYLSASERDNDFGLTRASRNVQDDVMNIVSNNCLYSSVTISKKNQYRFFYNTPGISKKSTKNFIGVKFSDQTSDNISWSRLTGMKIWCCSKWQDRDAEFILFSDETDYVMKMESGNTFDGEPINATFETPFMPVNDPKIRKTFYKHTVYTDISGSTDIYGNLVFDYRANNILQPQAFQIVSSRSSVAYNTGFRYNQGHKYSSGNNQIEFFNNVVGSGFVASLRYTITGGSSDINLNYAVLEYRTNERK